MSEKSVSRTADSSPGSQPSSDQPERQCGNLKDAIHLTGADVMGPNVDNSSPRINTSLLYKPPHTNPRLPVADVLSFNVIDPGIK